MKRSILFVMICMILLCSVLVADEPKKEGTPPQLLNYQGRLVDENGVPVPDGVYTVYFRIYDVPTEGQPVWDEQQDVTVFKGLYSVLLHISDEIDWTTDKFFAVRVEGQSEMAPRQQMASVPWAFQSETAGQAGHAVLADTATQANQATEAAHAAVATEASLAHDVDDASITTPKIADEAVAGPKLAAQFGPSQRQMLNFVPRTGDGPSDMEFSYVPFNWPDWTVLDLRPFGVPDTAAAVLLRLNFRDDAIGSYVLLAPQPMGADVWRRRVDVRSWINDNQTTQVIVGCKGGQVVCSFLKSGTGDDTFRLLWIAVQGWWEPAKTD
jgi:hypothetical protein